MAEHLHGAQLWPHGGPRTVLYTAALSLSLFPWVEGRRLWSRAHPMLRACHLFLGGAAAGGKTGGRFAIVPITQYTRPPIRRYETPIETI